MLLIALDSSVANGFGIKYRRLNEALFNQENKDSTF